MSLCLSVHQSVYVCLSVLDIHAPIAHVRPTNPYIVEISVIKDCFEYVNIATSLHVLKNVFFLK